MQKYSVFAIFEKGENKGYTVTFPDFAGCITEGDSLEEATYMAKEALELHLYGMEEEGIPIPKPSSNIEKFRLHENTFVVCITVWLDLVRDEMKNRSIKKTLTLPNWLNEEAEKEKINFSQVLQEALKHRLNIH